MRVISGEFRGRRLHTVSSRSVRPATDRVKQSLFDTLTTRLPLEGADVLDLYAGTGSLGIEALSRGARSATFVDSGPQAIECIKKNISLIRAGSRATVVRMDATRYMTDRGGQFDLIFADPPYEYSGTGAIPRRVFTQKLLRPGGCLLIEHTKNVIFEDHPSYEKSLTKQFGSTLVSFLVHMTE